MRVPRSGRALHALSVRAERDRPPTRPTHTPVVDLLGARRGPCSRYLTIYQILARTGKLWPTVRRTPLRSVAGRRLSISYFATRTLRSPTAVGKDLHLLRKTQNCCKELLRVRIEEATWED